MLILIISYKNHLTIRIIQNHAANVITRRIIHINSTLSSKLSIRFQKKKKVGRISQSVTVLHSPLFLPQSDTRYRAK